MAQLRVIYEAPTMDNGASSIRLQPAERDVAFHIATNEYVRNTGSNLCIYVAVQWFWLLIDGLSGCKLGSAPKEIRVK